MIKCKYEIIFTLQKQPPRGVPSKSCSENMQQSYRRTPMLECDFNKVALQPKNDLKREDNSFHVYKVK